MQVEAHIDFDSKMVVVLGEDDTCHTAPAVSMTNVQVVPDSNGAILKGELMETLGANYRPHAGVWRKARFARDGRVIDRSDQRVVKSTPAAIVTPANLYYVWK